MTLAKMEADADHWIIIGGDFNVSLDPDLDGSGGKPKFKESCKNWKICVSHLT